MKRKLEEKLSRFAFGDLESAEAARLEAEIAGDAEALEALATYRAMRVDLQALGAEIPTHQLSTERLRGALLDQGLRTAPKKAGYGWLWAPTAVAAMAFGLVFFKNMRQPTIPMAGGWNGGVVADNRVSAELPMPKFDFSAPTPPVVEKHPAPAPIVEAPVVRKVSHERPRSAVDRHRNDGRVADLKAQVAQQLHEAILAIDETPKVRVASLAADASPAPSTEAAPIVLIDNDTDNATGAKAATEVDSASNVLVGG